MKRNITLLLCLAVLLAACQGADKGQRTAIKIGSIQVSVNDFELAFKKSFHGAEETPALKKDFLDGYIMRLLILQEAERAGLDKDPQFLKDVEMFWHESLVKLMVDRKMNQLARHIEVSPREIEEYYRTHKEADFPNEELEAVSGQIKWLLAHEKQTELLEGWLRDLKRATRIRINHKLLGVKG